MIINNNVFGREHEHHTGSYTECTEAFVLGVDSSTGDLWTVMIGCPADMFPRMVCDLERQKDNILVMVP